jgi:hydroxyacylglutathione hydrolase
MTPEPDVDASAEVTPLRCLTDNYAYLVTCRSSNRVVVVDPSEAGPVLAALQARGQSLEAVWCTHHHLDHVGGVRGLREAVPGLRVFCSQRDATRIDGVTDSIRNGERLILGGLVACVIEVPGHTAGAIAFDVRAAVAPNAPGALFSGDTLFVGGAGRMFEGSPEQFWGSLARIRELPGATRLYCGHEYAAANYRFIRALWQPAWSAAASTTLEAHALRRALEAAEYALAANGCSVPSTLNAECAINPFLQCDKPALACALELPAGAPPSVVFATLRHRKNKFSA